jgi:hypothetical protein
MQKPLAQFRWRGQGPGAMRRALVSSGLIIALFCAIALSASPRLHERIHPDANGGHHECAVTLIASGNYHHAAPVQLIAAAVPAVQISAIPALTPQWVESPFLGACIFEHAPPARA